MIAAFSSLWHWLFEAECKTSADLLALSFAINAILTGLSIAKYNLCSYSQKLAVWYISKVTDDKLLARLERLGKDHLTLAKFSDFFSKAEESYKNYIQGEPIIWEFVKRTATIISAVASFVILAYEPTSRIGFALTFPYAILVILHMLWSLIRSGYLLVLSRLLSVGIWISDREKKQDLKIEDSVERMRNTRVALAKKPTP